MPNPNSWERRPPEQSGEYQFSGNFFVTPGVKDMLSKEEVFRIYIEIQRLVHELGGLDYLQIFMRESDSQMLFLIDQLTPAQINSGDYAPEDNHCVLMLAEEY